MRKRILALFVTVSIACAALTGCGETTETIDSSQTATTTVSGSYHIFRTTVTKEYLNFLETFDENKYEIIDISASMNTITSYSYDSYIVTYKDKETK